MGISVGEISKERWKACCWLSTAPSFSQLSSQFLPRTSGSRLSRTLCDRHAVRPQNAETV